MALSGIGLIEFNPMCIADGATIVTNYQMSATRSTGYLYAESLDGKHKSLFEHSGAFSKSVAPGPLRGQLTSFQDGVDLLQQKVIGISADECLHSVAYRVIDKDFSKLRKHHYATVRMVPEFLQYVKGYDKDKHRYNSEKHCINFNYKGDNNQPMLFADTNCLITNFISFSNAYPNEFGKCFEIKDHKCDTPSESNNHCRIKNIEYGIKYNVDMNNCDKGTAWKNGEAPPTNLDQVFKYIKFLAATASTYNPTIGVGMATFFALTDASVRLLEDYAGDDEKVKALIVHLRRALP